jgi:predicted 3-demethylubiquinone-9 3-methyltransferase (glyoxalase superfamily)
MTISGVTTYLWFDDDAMAAAELYVSIFPDSAITSVSYYQEGAQKPAGSVLTVEFELFGRPFAGLNAGPQFPHSEAVSFQVSCETQEEIDRVWSALIADGGQESMCGWCKDRFGVSWQVTAAKLGQLLSSPDPGAAQRAWAAMMGMRKIDIAGLVAAAEGSTG